MPKMEYSLGMWRLFSENGDAITGQKKKVKKGEKKVKKRSKKGEKKVKKRSKKVKKWIKQAKYLKCISW